MSWSTASRNNTFTSTSCGWTSRGSQKKTSTSAPPIAIKALACASTPAGPCSNRRTSRPRLSRIASPVAGDEFVFGQRARVEPHPVHEIGLLAVVSDLDDAEAAHGPTLSRRKEDTGGKSGRRCRRLDCMVETGEECADQNQRDRHEGGLADALARRPGAHVPT